MAEELRCCPFCGGEAHLTSDYSSDHDHTFYQVWHDCQTNPGTIRHSYGHALSLQVSTPWCANEEDAVRLWNRRAERTCQIVVSVDRSPASYGGRVHRCSSCGKALPGSLFRNGWTQLDFCPRCGARVTEVVRDAD